MFSLFLFQFFKKYYYLCLVYFYFSFLNITIYV